MKTKLLLGILFVAVAVVPAQAQLCGPGSVIRGYTAYPAPAYIAPPAVYAPVVPVMVAPPAVYQPQVVYHGGGYGGYHPYHYSPSVHLSFGGGYWGGGHFGGGHGGWRH